MSYLYQLIEQLSKEEVRTLKMFYGRTHKNNERKDVLLFDLIRKYKEPDDAILMKALGHTERKNNLNRTKSRLHQDIVKILNELYFDKNNFTLCLNYQNVSKLFQEKQEYKLAIHYLKKAEKLAAQEQQLHLLDTIYTDLIRLIHDIGEEDPRPYIAHKQKINQELKALNEIDAVLAAVSYSIRVSQNFSKNNSIIKQLEKTINQYTASTAVKQSPVLRFKIYHALSRILLQKQDYIGLEEYLKVTYKNFIKEKLFVKNNHETKLQMLVYLVNSLFKNDKITESVKYTELLHTAINEHEKILYDKYVFYYYNSLVINYSASNKEKAIQILEEAQQEKAIQNLPTFVNFIYLNLAAISFDLKNYKKALKNIIQTTLHNSFKKLDKLFQFKIYMSELIIRAEQQDLEILSKRVVQVKKEFAALLKVKTNAREKMCIEIIQEYARLRNSEKNTLNQLVVKYKKLYRKVDFDEADIISFNDWVKMVKI